MARVSAAWPELTTSAPGRPTAVVTPPSRLLQAGLERTLGGVHDAGVDVADLGQREQVLRVRGVAELEARGLVDRHRPGAGGRVGLAADVDLTCLETPGVAHRCGHLHPQFPTQSSRNFLRSAVGRHSASSEAA